jgi:hypothetical protein
MTPSLRPSQLWEIRAIYSTRARSIFTSFTGRSCASVLTNPICLTILIPSFTRPKIVCLPSKWGVGARVMKNCEPLVFGPELAILSIPAPVCFNAGWISSANFSLLGQLHCNKWFGIPIDGLTTASCPGTRYQLHSRRELLRIASLNHEVRYYPMELLISQSVHTLGERVVQ